MIRHLSIFIAGFLIAAGVTAVVRARWHQPYTESPALAAAAPAAAAPMSAAPAAETKPVNSICALCGMPVDPKLPTAMYQGQVIGFGCRACPPEFAKDPDRYGPAALRNQVVEE